MIRRDQTVYANNVCAASPELQLHWLGRDGVLPLAASSSLQLLQAIRCLEIFAYPQTFDVHPLENNLRLQHGPQ